MYSCAMPMLVLLMYGTGFFGSLTNSSNGFTSIVLPPLKSPSPSTPPRRRYSDPATASFGGQASNFRHRFVPVSNTHAFGSLSSPPGWVAPPESSPHAPL